jgi:hypothetical protein
MLVKYQDEKLCLDASFEFYLLSPSTWTSNPTFAAMITITIRINEAAMALEQSDSLQFDVSEQLIAYISPSIKTAKIESLRDSVI